MFQPKQFPGDWWFLDSVPKLTFRSLSRSCSQFVQQISHLHQKPGVSETGFFIRAQSIIWE